MEMRGRDRPMVKIVRGKGEEKMMVTELETPWKAKLRTLFFYCGVDGRARAAGPCW